MSNKKGRKNNVFYVALYLRLSREDGDKDESDSIANQRKMLQSYVDKQDDFIVYSEYVDDGFSGTNFNRPNFLRMIDDIQNGKVNCVIVKDLSRFGRDYIKAGYYLEEFFIDKDIRFVAINDNIDSFVREYDMMLPVKNVFNAQYAIDISKKVQSAFKVKQQSGEFVGAFPSYGYKKSSRDRHKLVIDEYAANIVRRVFVLFIEGNGKMKIAKRLNEEDILCPSVYKTLNGERYINANKLEKTSYWTYSTIHKMLQNEMYVGNLVQGKTKRRMKGRAKYLDESEWIVVKDTHEAIIDSVTWNKVQDLLGRNARAIGLNQNVSIFAGFLRCGDCERAMAKKKKYRKISDKFDSYEYQCGSYVRYGSKFCSKHNVEHGILEKIILSDLKQIMQSVKDLRKLIDEQQKVIPQKSDILLVEKQKMENELARVKRLKKECYEDYKEGLLSKVDYLSYRIEYEEKEKLLEKQMGSISIKTGEDSDQNIFESQWIKDLLKLKEVKVLDRKIITEMIHMIYIYEENRIKIIYNFSNDLESLFELVYKDESA